MYEVKSRFQIAAIVAKAHSKLNPITTILSFRLYINNTFTIALKSL